MPDPPGDGNGQLAVSGFGITAALRGPILIVMVLLAALILVMIWRLEERITAEIRSSFALRSQSTSEMVRNVQDEHNNLGVRLNVLEAKLDRIICLLGYTAEERRAIRTKIEKEPALNGAWCP